MKVLIYPSHRGIVFTPNMKEIMEKYEGIKQRTGEIIEYIENNCEYCESDNYDLIRASLVKDREKILKVKTIYNSDLDYVYWIYIESYGVTVFKIEEVDTSRPWTIESYDSCEHVKYLDERKCLDEELNYWE